MRVSLSLSVCVFVFVVVDAHILYNRINLFVHFVRQHRREFISFNHNNVYGKYCCCERGLYIRFEYSAKGKNTTQYKFTITPSSVV